MVVRFLFWFRELLLVRWIFRFLRLVMLLFTLQFPLRRLLLLRLLLRLLVVRREPDNGRDYSIRKSPLSPHCPSMGPYLPLERNFAPTTPWEGRIKNYFGPSLENLTLSRVNDFNPLPEKTSPLLTLPRHKSETRNAPPTPKKTTPHRNPPKPRRYVPKLAPYIPRKILLGPLLLVRLRSQRVPVCRSYSK